MSQRIPVETVFTIKDTGVVAAYLKAAQAAESYYHAAQKANEVGNSGMGLGGVAALGGAVAAVAAGAMWAGDAMVRLNSEAEKNRNKLAGDIQVYGYAKTYADGLLLADKYLQKIREDAAALPGEDSDFIRSFGIAFPAMAEKGRRSMMEMVDLSNKLTAVLVAKGVDPSQIGRDIGLMVRGRAGMDVRSFVELQSVLGGKKSTITTEEWNKLKDEERFKRLEEATTKFNDAIEAFGTTWEAVESTAKSYLKEFERVAGAPLFDAIKNYLSELNKTFERNKEWLEGMGSTAMILAVKSAEFIKSKLIGAYRQEFLDSQFSGPPKEVYDQGALTAAFSAREYVGFGLSGGRAEFAFNELASLGNSIVEFLMPLGESIAAVASAFAGPVAALIPAFSYIVDIAGSVALALGGGLLRAITVAADLIGPALTWIATGLSDAIKFFLDEFLVGIGYFRPMIDLVVQGLGLFVEGIQKAYNWIAAKLGGSGGSTGKGFWDEIREEAAKNALETRKWLGIDQVDAAGGIANFLARKRGEEYWAEESRRAREEEAEARALKKKPPSVNQDFRGSKFNIEQRFDKDFEPGRILTAIREDVAALAARRTTAGITPMFGHGQG